MAQPRRRWIAAGVALCAAAVIAVSLLSTSGGSHHSTAPRPMDTLTATALGPQDSHGAAQIAATDRSLLWTPPTTHSSGGHTYRLFTGSGSVLAIVKTEVARWISTAWCGPARTGRHPSPQAVSTTFFAGSPGATGAARSPATYIPPPTSGGVPATGLDFLPAPAGTIKKASCAWVAGFPRIITNGGSVPPPTHPTGPVTAGYPALYGTVLQATVPVELEVSYLSAAKQGQHLVVGGNLVFVVTNQHLDLGLWTPNMYWESPTWVPAPTYILSGKNHWNYAGSPVGRGVEIPSGAATAF